MSSVIIDPNRLRQVSQALKRRQQFSQPTSIGWNGANRYTGWKNSKPVKTPSVNKWQFDNYSSVRRPNVLEYPNKKITNEECGDLFEVIKPTTEWTLLDGIQGEIEKDKNQYEQVLRVKQYSNDELLRRYMIEQLGDRLKKKVESIKAKPIGREQQNAVLRAFWDRMVVSAGLDEEAAREVRAFARERAPEPEPEQLEQYGIGGYGSGSGGMVLGDLDYAPQIRQELRVGGIPLVREPASGVGLTEAQARQLMFGEARGRRREDTRMPVHDLRRQRVDEVRRFTQEEEEEEERFDDILDNIREQQKRQLRSSERLLDSQERALQDVEEDVDDLEVAQEHGVGELFRGGVQSQPAKSKKKRTRRNRTEMREARSMGTEDVNVSLQAPTRGSGQGSGVARRVVKGKTSRTKKKARGKKSRRGRTKEISTGL